MSLSNKFREARTFGHGRSVADKGDVREAIRKIINRMKEQGNSKKYIIDVIIDECGEELTK